MRRQDCLRHLNIPLLNCIGFTEILKSHSLLQLRVQGLALGVDFLEAGGVEDHAVVEID